MRKIMPTTYLLLCLLVMLALRFVLPGACLIPSPWNLAGLLPIAFGVWINLAADRAIHAARTTVKPEEQPAALITTGAFAISRNPMYLGFAAILAGAAIMLGVCTPGLMVIVFIVLMEVLFIPVEQRNLERVFGPAWQDYRRRVRRCL
jgi:protein-S-isoprenylcysteine O-methyltransferase Ste14